MWGASVVVELSSRRGAERERGKGLVRRAAHRRGGGRHESGPPWALRALSSRPSKDFVVQRRFSQSTPGLSTKGNALPEGVREYLCGVVH